MTPSPDSNLMLGVSWYPEMWPESEWPSDVERMAEVGMSLVRLFEFAWKRFEPSEGVYDFAWARRVLDLLHDRGIRAMLGTPTAAPPAWLTTAYPEVLKTASDGKCKTHGQRKHYNVHSLRYRAFSRNIVRKMREELGGHPAVHSWQIDNEMSGFDYGSESARHFHDWLRRRYGSIEALNDTWGLNFWSQTYDSFEQIPLVVAKVGSIESPERNHPSLIMDIARFQNEGWSSFMKEQCDEIRKGPDTLVTTNMTGFISEMDWWSHFRPMDRAGASMYADLSYYYLNFSRFDRLRAEKPAPYWLLETAPNWSGGGPVWNIHHDERGIKAFSWLAILLGGSMVLYWQWRSHWAGQEMQHGTCVDQNGNWMPGKQAWQELAAAFSEHGEFLLAHPAARGPVGILADCENAWLFSIDPIHDSNRHADRLRDEIQMPLVRRHIHRDILHPEADYSPYRLLVVHQMSMLSAEARQRLRAWVEAGGRLLIGPMTGNRTEHMTLWRGTQYGGLEELFGADQALRFSPHWVENEIQVQFDDGAACSPRIWCEAFAPHPGTDVLARYKGGYGDGLPAIVSRRLGKGRVITVGTALDENCRMNLFDRLAGECGIAPLAREGEGILCCPRVDADGKLRALGLINYRKTSGRIQLPAGGRDLLSGETLPASLDMAPLQVRILQINQNPDTPQT